MSRPTLPDSPPPKITPNRKPHHRNGPIRSPKLLELTQNPPPLAFHHRGELDMVPLIIGQKTSIFPFHIYSPCHIGLSSPLLGSTQFISFSSNTHTHEFKHFQANVSNAYAERRPPHLHGECIAIWAPSANSYNWAGAPLRAERKSMCKYLWIHPSEQQPFRQETTRTKARTTTKEPSALAGGTQLRREKNDTGNLIKKVILLRWAHLFQCPSVSLLCVCCCWASLYNIQPLACSPESPVPS